MNSMTGYGRCDIARDGRALTVELKSVNHRFLDVAFRMPRSFAFVEDALRKRIGGRVSRGHVDVFITYKNTREDTRAVRADAPLIGAYMEAIEDAARASGLVNDVSLSRLIGMPDALTIEDEKDDLDALSAVIIEGLDGALRALCDMRAREGFALKEHLLQCLSTLDGVRDALDQRYPAVVEQYRAAITARMAELLHMQPNEARIVEEAAIFADKSAVAEETHRLAGHINEARAALEMNEPIGRKLDFWAQEMLREVNTTGSKSQDMDMTRLVVKAKAEVEKIKEQVQNAE